MSEDEKVKSEDENDQAETPQPSDDGNEEKGQTETPELSDEGKEQVEQMQAAYNDERETAVLPGTDGTITGVAVNEWLDDDGNPKFGKEEQKKKADEQSHDDASDEHTDTSDEQSHEDTSEKQTEDAS